MTAHPNTRSSSAAADTLHQPEEHVGRQASVMSHSPSTTPLMSAQRSWDGVHSPEITATAEPGTEGGHTGTHTSTPASHSSAHSDDDTRRPAPAPCGGLGARTATPEVVLSASQAASLLEQWIDKSVVDASPSGCHLRDILTLRSTPPLRIRAFTERVFTYSACEPSCFTVALALVRRVTTRPVAPHVHALCAASCGEGTSAQGSDATCSGSISMCPLGNVGMPLTKYNVHRLLAAAVTLAIKSTQDVYHPMAYYGSVFGVTAYDLRRMETALMTLLDHSLYVGLAEAAAIVSASL